MLLEYGHPIIPFGLRGGKIQNHEIVTEWPKAEIVDTVTIYVNPALQSQYEQHILDLHPKRVVFNPGTENPDFENKLRLNGIEALEACTLVLLRSNQY